MSLGSRLQEARQAKKLNQSQLGKLVGKGKSVISSWEHDVNKPDAQTIFDLCDILDVEPNWLMEWNGNKTEDITIDEMEVVEMYRKLNEYDRLTVRYIMVRMSQRPEFPELPDGQIATTMTLDMYLLRPSAGKGNIMLDDLEKMKLTVPITKTNQKADFAVEVDGHSMDPRIKDGETIFVRSQPSVEDGEIGLFLVNGEVVVKQKKADRLRSINPAFDDIPIGPADNVICYGKVLGK